VRIGALLIAGTSLLAQTSCGAGSRHPSPPPSPPRPVSSRAILVSPQPGTPDASPETQISFLGAPAASLGRITVVGHSSGHHSGRLMSYAAATGASFLPSTPFAAGERVEVRVDARPGGLDHTLRFSFTVARTAQATPPPNVPGSGPGGPSPHPVRQTFVSRPTLHPPQVTVSASAGRPTACGDVFLAPLTSLRKVSRLPQRGPMILDSKGRLLWWHPVRGFSAENLSVQRYHGSPVLTWWQGHINPLGYGQGTDVILDRSYRVIAQVHGGNGYSVDLHEFVLGPRDTAWFTIYQPVRADLSYLKGPAYAHSSVVDSIVQEVDLRTGLVMFEWHSLGHVSLRDSYSTVRHSDYDFSHINSIQILGDRLVLSARNLWSVFEVSLRSGRVLWRVGGKHSTFHLGQGVQFAWQHDAHLHSNGLMTVFDNEAAPQEQPLSRALELRVDRRRDTITLVHAFTHPHHVIAGTQGSVQLLPGGSTFVGWGSEPYFSEFSPSGRLLFDAHLSPPIQSYRAYCYQWTGRPATQPTVAVRASGPGRMNAYATWNGATEVASWELLAGRTSSSLKSMAQAQSAGFETVIPVPPGLSYVAVRALDARKRVLATSPAVKA